MRIDVFLNETWVNKLITFTLMKKSITRASTAYPHDAPAPSFYSYIGPLALVRMCIGWAINTAHMPP